MFEKILTVCTGNICRSPLAEFLLREQLACKEQTTEVRSAGIGALIGHPAEENASSVALQHGTSLEGHRAQQINNQLTRWADLILVMEQHHMDNVLDQDPTARGKTFLLGHWNNREIPDPYRKGDAAHQRAYEEISNAVSSWISKL